MNYKFGQKIFVVTGSLHEFMEYRDKTLKSFKDNNVGMYRISDIVYVRDGESFYGCRDVHGVFYGNWKQHPDIKYIIEQIMMCNKLDDNGPLPKIVREFYQKTAAWN